MLPYTKRADSDVAMETPIEQVFANIAHSYIQDRSPKLLDYEVGFQLLDKDDDSSKAIGVMGFKAGSQFIYCPMVYCNNEVKGHEILVLKNDDLFVPNDEDWVNYIIERRPNTIGKGKPRDEAERYSAVPDMARITNPLGKYASELPEWVHGFLPFYVNAILTPDAVMNKKASGDSKLAKFLKSAGLRGFEALHALLQTYPQFAPAVELVCPSAELAKIAEEVEEEAKHESDEGSPVLNAESLEDIPDSVEAALFQEEPGDPISEGDLRILWANGVKTTEDLFDETTDKDLESFDERGYVIHDERPDDRTSIAYTESSVLRLMNPASSGVYDVLVNKDKFKKLVILVTPLGADGNQPTAVVLEPKSKKYQMIHPSKIFVVGDGRNERVEFEKWFDKLPKSRKLSSGGDYLAVECCGKATMPFYVLGSNGSSKSCDSYRVAEGCGCFNRSHVDYGTDGRNIPAPTNEAAMTRMSRGEKYKSGEFIVNLMSGDGVPMRHAAGECYIPKAAKIVSLSQFEKGEGIACGNLVDFKIGLRKAASDLKVVADGFTVKVTDRGQSTTFTTKSAAVLGLVVNQNLREDVANEIIATAEKTWNTRRTGVTFQLKRAEINLQDGMPKSPQFPDEYKFETGVFDQSVPTSTTQPTNNTIEGMGERPGARDRYTLNPPDPLAVQGVQDAVRSGKKDIMDAALVRSLLSSVKNDDFTDKRLDGVVSGMDDAGRLLFGLYADRERFQDRYGQADIDDLETTTRDAFQSSGKMAIFLKAKSLDLDITKEIELND